VWISSGSIRGKVFQAFRYYYKRSIQFQARNETCNNFFPTYQRKIFKCALYSILKFIAYFPCFAGTRSSRKNYSLNLLWYDTDLIENDASNNSSVFLRICCRGNILTEPLPNNGRGYTYRHIDWWHGFMKHAIEMSLGNNIYMPTFMKIVWGIQKLIGEIHRNTGSNGNLISLFLFFQNKETRCRRKKENRRLILPRFCCFFCVLTPCN
jgi:hypothetical protein